MLLYDPYLEKKKKEFRETDTRLDYGSSEVYLTNGRHTVKFGITNKIHMGRLIKKALKILSKPQKDRYTWIA